MPDNGGRTEGDDLPLLLETPAEVDVVSGLAVFGIEAANLIKGPAVEGHVASWNVLGNHVGEQDMARTSGSRCYTSLMPVLGRRGDVRATDARIIAGKECANQIVEPVGIGHAVAVRVGNDLAGSMGGAYIAGDTQAHVGLMDRLHPRVVGDDFLGVVLGAVVDEHDLVVGIIQLLERTQAGLEGLAAVVTADDDGNFRETLKGRGVDDGALLGEETSDGFECLLGGTIPADKAEGPVENFVAAPVPLIGPGVENRSGQATADHGVEVPADHLGLLLLGVADRVHAELTHHERLVVSEVLEACQVALKVLAAVQVDVEGQEVDVLRQQILGRRIARVGVQCAGILATGNVDQMLDEFGDALRPEPADHGGGDLVAEQVAEDGVVPLVLADGLDDRLLDGGAHLRVVEEFDMLHPGDAQENPDAVLEAEIKKPARGIGVDANEVRPALTDGCEILGGLFPGAKLEPLRVGSKGTVGHALDEELFLPLEEELRPDGNAFGHEGYTGVRFGGHGR